MSLDSLEGRGQGCRAEQGRGRYSRITVVLYSEQYGGWDGLQGLVDGEAKHCGLREMVENWAWKRWIAIYDWTARPQFSPFGFSMLLGTCEVLSPRRRVGDVVVAPPSGSENSVLPHIRTSTSCNFQESSEKELFTKG